MKTTKNLLALLVVSAVVVIACKKETSFEQGNSTASVGSLSVDATGGCLGAVISGVYYKDTALKSSNYVDVSVQVDTAGTYTITTDTVNGYYFKASGTFSNTGAQAVRLVGGGKPLSIGSNVFTVSYNGTTCEFSVNVTAAPPGGGGGGGGNAAFTITCTGPVFAGTYPAGTALTSANTVTLNVNVTTIGTWNVTTAPAVNGIIFAGTGTFSTTGAQTIQLSAAGSTPTTAGTNNYTVTGGTGTCNFPLTVTAPAPPDYFPRTQNSNWSYEYENAANDSLLIYSQGTTTQAGNTYNIFWYNDGVGVDTFGYYRRNAADYFEFGDMSYGILDDPYYGEYLFLKDNQIVGGTWNSNQFSGAYTDQTSGMTGTITLRWEFKILQQNGTVSVTSSTGTVNYTNVIEVRQEMRQFFNGTWELVAYFRNYFARDKGLVKQELYDNMDAIITFSEVRRLVVY